MFGTISEASMTEREYIHGDARNDEKVFERKVDVCLLWRDGVGADLKRPHLRDPEIGVSHGILACHVLMP